METKAINLNLCNYIFFNKADDFDLTYLKIY